MNFFLARQPIFDIKNNVIAYELLFRNGTQNYCDIVDGNSATLNVISNAFYTIGIDSMTNGKKAFINFTDDLIKKEVVTIIPPELVAVEILEDVEPTKKIIHACKNLKNKGYSLVLDDFVFDKKYEELIDLIDIIKVDFRITTGSERKHIIDKVKSKKIKFLAEKVETIEEFYEAKSYGYSYFQGYYFSKPVMLSGKDIPQNKIVSLKLMDQLSKKELTLESLENLILKDVALFCKLIKYVNSSLFGFKEPIESIKHAVSILGEENLIKWLYVILINDIKEDSANENLNLAVIRARFSENICVSIGMKDKAFQSYTIGIVSLLDVILRCPIDYITNELGLYKEVYEVLKDKNNCLGNIFKLVIAYEKAEWENVDYYSKIINIDKQSLNASYLDALKWSQYI
jgi:EAL and modified HD-GYP domain-containing signal transduction protein